MESKTKGNPFISGSLYVENISDSPFDTLFRVVMQSPPRPLLARIKDVFNSKKEFTTTIHIDRLNAKTISTYLHTHISAADKSFKEIKKANSTPVVDMESAEKPKKRVYKSRKPKTDTTTAISE
jgi:hypothetical protein